MASTLRAVTADPRAALAAFERVWEVGEAVLPLPLDAPADHLERLLHELRPASLTHVEADGSERTRSLPDAVPVADDVALVVATTGSTGPPKGVLLTHDALAASVAASLARLACQPGDRWTLALPVHHVAGITVLLRARALGTDAEVVAQSELPSATADHVSLVPTQLTRLLDAGVDVARWRTILLGGAAPPPGLLARAAAAGARVVTSYGMTETCGGCVYDGVPLDDVEVAIADDGRIRVRGPVLFGGYRPDAAAAARDGLATGHLDAEGWFTTADLGHLDADGRLQVLGRADDVVVTGGENVSAPAVRAALERHPAVAEAAVVGRPDGEWGSVVVAVVVPSQRGDPPTLDELRRWVRTALPASHAPRDLRVVAALPRDGLGKVTRAALERLVRDR